MTGKSKTAPRAVGCFLIICIASVVSIPTVSSEPTEDELTAIVEQVQLSNVSMLRLDWRGNSSFGGSGFFVDEYGAVFTASHVVENAKRTGVQALTEEIYRINGVLAQDIGRDVILLSTPVPPYALYPLPLASSLPEPGEDVVFVQWPGRTRTGVFEAAPKIPERERLMVITGHTEPGWSGSPVMNTKGEVVGIVISRRDRLTFAAPIMEVAALLSGKSHSFFPWESDASDPPNDSPEDLYWAGRLVQIYGRGRDDGLPYFEQAFEKDPEYAEAYIEAAFCYRSLGRYDKAIDPFKNSIRLRPSDPSLYVWLALTCDWIGRHDDAIRSYRQAIQIDPNDAQKHYYLGNVYSTLQQRDEAIACYEEAIRLDPSGADAYFALVLEYRMLKRYHEAIETYKKQVRVSPTDAEAYRALAFTCGIVGRHGEATQAYEETVRMRAENTHFHYMLALNYMWEVYIWSALGEYHMLKDLDQDKADELFDSICGWYD
ncbi:serine protease [candidate division TA06 bacterium]|uniref:Serine protease n=1 Tax=candidate division TA06 bacterium TaxID=2250710 RepID=A0A523XL08_UNCT6|nr:MAG: serine protease [candidate division TA06 bacterium]